MLTVVVELTSWPSGLREAASNTVVVSLGAAFEDLALKKVKTETEFHSPSNLPSSTVGSTPHISCSVVLLGVEEPLAVSVQYLVWSLVTTWFCTRIFYGPTL